MKYSTINYDSNRPMPNVVKAPTNSDIGVAIKVWKDGQEIDAGLSVNGISAASTRNGWQLFELSTDSGFGRVDYDVRAVKEASAYAEIEDMCLTGNSTPRDKTSNLSPWDLYDTTLADKRLYAKDVKNYETIAIISTSTQVSSTVVPLENTGFHFGDSVYYPIDGMWCLRVGSEYIPSYEYMEVSSSVPVRAQLKMPAHSDISVILNLNVDSGDGFNDNYKLTVVGENENAIEVK